MDKNPHKKPFTIFFIPPKVTIGYVLISTLITLIILIYKIILA